MAIVQQLWRFPVKSMQGEPVNSFDLTERGVVGDRVWALLDDSDGQVVSAKNPRKWKRVLEVSASFVDEPTAADPAPPVVITLPDGTAARSDVAGDDASGVLSSFLDRPVRLTAQVPVKPTFEETWPADVEGLGPSFLIDATRIGMDGEDSITKLDLASAAAGTFFDLARLHLITTATLAALRAAQADGDFDVRRYRANVVVSDAGEGFVENDWVGSSVALGAGGAVMQVTIPTMRCVMTTMAQPGLERNLSLLQTIARTNRQTVFGGEWACAGVYGDVGASGRVAVGDTVTVTH
ncbi:MAG TPA: MOSC N-terminal beta barrel domain-containing protein [Acidimicrobiales bacterium]|nr:MOSC N-terminal beta barrel domain-containing protein [Acidimicrobiales bacterium]